MWARQLPAAPAQALTREQVLRAYTAGSAYAEFAEDTKGRLAPGYVADLAVLSQDVLAETVPVDALPATTSLLPIIGGEVTWHDPAFQPSVGAPPPTPRPPPPIRPVPRRARLVPTKPSPHLHTQPLTCHPEPLPP